MTPQRPRFTVGEILLCQVVFSDYSDVRMRPVVVLSTAEYDTGGDDLLIAAMTSNLSSPVRHKLIIKSSDPDFGGTGLRGSSAVLCAKLLTIHYGKMSRRLGSLSEDKMRQLREQLREIFDLM